MDTALRQQALGKKIPVNVECSVECMSADKTEQFTYDVVSPEIEPDMVGVFWGWSSEKQTIFVSSSVPTQLQDWVARLEHYRYFHQVSLAEAVEKTIQDVPALLLSLFIGTVGRFCLLLRDEGLTQEPSDQSNQANEALVVLGRYQSI